MTVKGLKVWNLDPVKTKELAVQLLVIAQVQRVGRRTRKWNADHFQQGGDILFQMRFSVEDFHQVKDDIRSILPDLFEKSSQIIVNSQQAHIVVILQQGAMDIILGIHVIGVREFLGVIVSPRTVIRTAEQHQDLCSSTHSLLCLLSPVATGVLIILGE